METLILTFLIANAIFWGLFPHNAHCLFINNINEFFKMNINCPDHSVHILLGFLFYTASVYFTQYK